MPSLNFKGKALVQNFHLLVPYHELKPVKSKSLTPKVSLHDNLVVHGDNLKALKSLLPYYHGKVKCIYIDPPYNTGNEDWVYNDNVSSPMIQEWLGKVVDREDLTRHDKWLCMMMPRLKLLREFLTDDGVIFVSIDDNEVHWLRGLMDEVFGEENFVDHIRFGKSVYPPKNTDKSFSARSRLHRRIRSTTWNGSTCSVPSAPKQKTTFRGSQTADIGAPTKWHGQGSSPQINTTRPSSLQSRGVLLPGTRV